MKNIKKPDRALYQNMATKMTTPDRLLRKLISEIVEWRPTSLTRLVEGIGNEVYRITSHNQINKEFILRINHKSPNGFKLEQWAFNKLKGVVPTPTIIKLGELQNGTDKLFYCAEAVVPGKSLDKILDTDIDENVRFNFGVLAGEILAKIHSVPTDGFGHFVTPGKGEHPTLAESLVQKNDIADLHRAATIGGLSASDVDNAITRITEVDNKESPHLLHVDYAPKHIFVHNQRVTGVIDFEICMSGIAATDINRFRTQDSRINLQSLIEGYEKITKLPENFWQVMYSVQLHSSLRTMLYHLHITGSNQEIQKAADEVKQLLRSGQALRK